MHKHRTQIEAIKAEIAYLEKKQARIATPGIATKLTALKAKLPGLIQTNKLADKAIKAIAAAQGATHIHHGAAAAY